MKTHRKQQLFENIATRACSLRGENIPEEVQTSANCGDGTRSKKFPAFFLHRYMQVRVFWMVKVKSPAG